MYDFFRNKVPTQGQQAEDISRANATNNNRPNTNSKTNSRPFWNDTSNGPQLADKENHMQNQKVSREDYNVRVLMRVFYMIL